VRFLIDECLSVDLVTVAGESGHEARHVAHLGRAGWKDWNVVRYARDGNFVLVTNNAISGSFMRRSRCMAASSS
jgi:predicted nuclease of predicted toxin-antitoxin system